MAKITIEFETLNADSVYDAYKLIVSLLPKQSTGTSVPQHKNNVDNLKIKSSGKKVNGALVNQLRRKVGRPRKVATA